MQLSQHPDEITSPFNNGVITIGNLDGVHIGHQALLYEVIERAHMIETSIAMTFEPPPLRVLKKNHTPPLITLLEQKVELIERSGVGVLICVPFTLEFAAVSATSFVEELLVRKIGMKAIVMGEDYAFGRNREGNIDLAAVEAGLQTITRSTLAFLEAARACGIAGVFYAAQQATYRLMDRAGYARFGEPYDRRLLEAASGLWLNMLHLHGEAVMFDVAVTYPVQVINWHDRETSPTLGEARRMTKKALCGGLRRWETMVLGTPEAVRSEAAEAMRATAGRGFVLGTGCVVPVVAPRANLRAARASVELRIAK